MDFVSKLSKGSIGNLFTKRFLISKNIKMVSEIDYKLRLKMCVNAFILVPLYLFLIAFFSYFLIVVNEEKKTADIEELSLYVDQIKLIKFFIIINLFHIFTLFIVLIVCLNMTMGKGVMVFSILFDFFYILETLFFASFLFILHWLGFFKNFHDFSEFTDVIQTKWIWILVYFLALISFSHMRNLFRFVNSWNREWIRLDRYMKTSDKENSFIFKTWVDPSEIKSRKLMIAASWLIIFFASVLDVLDAFDVTKFGFITYIILGFGYFIFITSYIVPYSKISFIFYWGIFLIVFGFFIYSLYMIQNKAWQENNWYMYIYAFSLIPFTLSLSSAIKYTWVIKNKAEIKAIVPNTFTNYEQFEKLANTTEEKDSI